MNIVIIEDDQFLAASYQRILTADGHDVQRASHAVAGIDAIDEFHPDVIVLDVLLAGTTALTLLHELQSHADLAAIPIVMVTNLGDQLSLDDVKPYGVKRLLDKVSLTPEELKKAVRGAAK